MKETEGGKERKKEKVPKRLKAKRARTRERETESGGFRNEHISRDKRTFFNTSDSDRKETDLAAIITESRLGAQ